MDNTVTTPIENFLEWVKPNIQVAVFAWVRDWNISVPNNAPRPITFNFLRK